MGLLVSVYRDSLGDCTNGGMSANVDTLCLVNVDGPFEPSEECPAALLVKNNVGATKSVKIVPTIKHESDEWVSSGGSMFGGNFASTSDSRLGQAIARLIGNEFRFWPAVAIHDRFE